ncbi:MAG: phosphoribosylglycinamide formyltransferase [Deltaproteobacteria bacterium]|nr:phosphoribosylglycinamide formyltransferase [Deltaproteobacteria bacterium]MBI3077766.1 phosphoribosylglycinamide formyltransferase [Deltaproteobacteria bacterium]
MSSGRVVRLAMLASGSGTNFQAIVDAIEAGRLQARAEVLLSDNASAPALERARRHGIPTVVLDSKAFADRKAFDQQIVQELAPRGIDLIALAGYMRLVGPELIQAYPARIMNIHPALLPAFPGLHGQRKALAYGVKVSGCSVHFVDEGVDTGPLIIQAVVPVYDEDTEESLAARILHEEHRIYPQAIQLFAEGRLVVEGRRVRVSGHPRPPATALANPTLVGF